ncbi:unnamed protein product [Spirodela intermedia]|uniref:Uncharacterized protein n=1 Tax=Spirodela intermedia TaxID=51605 RepID=A0A7I8JJN2_SPIIN|nr:unnamed protein product [Spirodela intermedia]CAA6670358.1 unnamed protein product [Spirodela intermedia]
MESLLANYGSSDEEGSGREGEQKKRNPPPPPSKPLYGSTRPPRPPPPSSPISSSIPPPSRSSSSSSAAANGASSTSLFSSLPRPKASPSSSIFSSLPPPKSTPSASSSSSSSFFSSLSPPEPSGRKVVQFRPSIDVSLLRAVDIDEDDEESKEKRRKRTLDFSSKPLSSIIPAPKNTLCLTALPLSSNEPPAPEQAMTGAFGDQGSYEGQWVGAQSDYGAEGGDAAASWPSTAGSYGTYGSYGSYEGYESYEYHAGDWRYGSSAVETVGATEVLESARALGKRWRNAIPSEILEVKQEELVKNRPREDQVKLTGIAFGPSYQPVASSGKGKPSKLHRRKHQIGSLYHDMRQKETELAERRSRGFLTKKETQAKYGW